MGNALEDIILLRILPKQNTALLLPFCVSVTGVTTHIFFNIYICIHID